MEKYNILYAPLIIVFMAIYLILIIPFGTFFGVEKFDKVIMSVIKFSTEKKFMAPIVFLLNLTCWFFAWKYGLKIYFYKLINSI